MSVFRFKQFSVIQHNSAAKIGTDGVLIGAWVPLPDSGKSVLDIGAGTGLIALMICQRFDNVAITAIEKDKSAWEECKLNFQNSPWKDRLNAINQSLSNYETLEKFDLIVSNPPFYTAQSFAPDQRRNSARNTISLPFSELIKKSSEMLAEAGFFVVILPFKEMNNFIEMCADYKLYPFKILKIKGNATRKFSRCLMAFKRKKEEAEIKDLQIEVERHNYTEDYQQLTKEFYLKM